MATDFLRMTWASVAGRWRDSLIVKNTLWMLLGHGLRALLQAVYFILLARTLGVEGYGAFIGVTALVAILAPFASLGSGNILIKHVARDATVFSQYWGNAILMSFASGLVLLVMLLALARVILPGAIPMGLVVCVAVSDLFFARLLDVSGQAFQAFQRLERTAQFQVLITLCRLVAVLLLIVLTRARTAEQWAAFYLLSTAVSGGVSVWLVCRELGLPGLALGRMLAELKEGFYFSVSHSAAGVYNDIDKTMLVRYSTLESAGIYGAAYRLIDVSFTPVRSLLFASYAKFFQHGVSGVRGSLQFAMRFVPTVAGYGLLVGVVLCLAAPVVPWVLGEGYRNSIGAIRWLAVLPLLKALHYFAADTLTGAGFQGIRSGLQVVVAVFNVLVNLWTIPLYSWRGAAWSSLASDGLLMVLLWVTVLQMARRSGAGSSSVATTPGGEQR